MSTHRNLMTVCFAAVFALGLAACSSSSDDPPMTGDNGDGMQMPDPAIAERATINSAITTARTAVAGLTDDASDTEINAAEMAVAAAKKAVMDAANVPDTEKAAFNTTVTTLEGNLATKKTSIMTAREDAADAMKAAMAKTGKALRAALGGPEAGGNALANNEAAPTLAAAGLTINAAAGAGALGATDDPAAVTLKAGDSAGSLGSWMGMDYALTTGTGDTKVTNEARVYNNKGPGKRVAFARAGYTVIAAGNDNAGSVLLVTAGTTETGIDLAKVAVTAFSHSGTQTHPIPDNNVALKLRGTFDGAPGEYSCTGTCSSTNDGSGGPSALGGTWHFKPDTGAMVHQPDDTYLYYGWWVSKDKDGGPTAASAFTGIVQPDTPLAAATAGSALTGSATYAGHAAGKFAMSNPLDGTGNGGHFTADAELMATFGSDATAGMTGTIDNFRLNDGSEDPGWSVSLARGAWAADGAITAPTTDPTVWSINGNKALASGTWSGQMYDEMPGDAPDGDGSNIPTTVTGTFYSEFSTIGRMAGAFGADRQ